MEPVDFDLESQAEQGESGYRPLSGLALVALVVALLSLLAWMNEWTWVFAPLGILLAAVALRRIAASDPPMLGRRLAVLALGLSLFNAVGVASNGYVHRYRVDQEARQFAEYWFSLQLAGKTAEAVHFVKTADVPTSPQGAPGKTLRVDMKTQLLETYCQGKEIQALLALGDRAQVRYFDTEWQERSQWGDAVKQTYAVTYDQEGTKTSFFIALTMDRRLIAEEHCAQWKITDILGGAVPEALQAHAAAARQAGANSDSGG